MASTALDAARAVPGRHLLKLPKEIRLLIMYPPSEMRVYAIKGSLHRGESTSRKLGGDCDHHTALLRTCHVICAEAKATLYSNTRFVVRFQDHHYILRLENDPWLKIPQSIVPVDNMRKLTLKFECHTSAVAHKRAWPARLQHTLRGARSIQEIHLELTRPIFSDNIIEHDATRVMLGILGQTLKRGIVTAELNLNLASEDFNPSDYYIMVAKFGWKDKTHEIFSKTMAGLREEHAEYSERLEENASQLRSLAEDRIRHMQERTSRIGYIDVVTDRFTNMMTEVLAEMKRNEFDLRIIEYQMAETQSHFDILKPAGVKDTT